MLKFLTERQCGRHTYASCSFRRIDRIREHALPFLLQRFRQQNGPLNKKASSLLADPDRLIATFCELYVNNDGITKHDLEDLQTNWQEKGFTSAKMTRFICLMVDPSSSKRTREAELSSMKNKIVRNASNKRRRKRDRANQQSHRSLISAATTNTNTGWSNNNINVQNQ